MSEESKKYHRLLKRQLKKVDLDLTNPQITQLLALVDSAYFSFEEDLKHTERILDQSSNELFKANQELQQIAEKKTLEAQESNTRLKEVFDSINEVVFRAGTNRNLSMINPAWEKITGFKVEESLGKDLLDFFSPESQEELANLFVNCSANSISKRLKICRKDEEIRYVQVVVNQEEKEGKVFIAGTISDVHQQVISQKENERLALIAQRTKNIIVTSDLEGQITWVNNSFETLTGYQLEEIKGKRPGDFLQGEKTNPTTVKEIGQQLAKREPFFGEIYNYSKDGRGYWLELYIDPFYDHDGNMAGYIAIENEITERHIQREKLKASEAKLSAIINSISDVISFKNLNGEYELGNNAFLELAGIERHQLEGSRDEQLFSKEFVAEILEEDQKALQLGSAEAREELVPFPDGTQRILETRKSIVKDRDKNPIGIVGVSRDVTQIRSAEKRIRESQERLALATKAMNIGIWDWNIEQNELIWDNSMYELFEIKPEDFSGAYSAFESTLHPDDKARVWATIEECLEKQEDFAATFRIIGTQGNVKHIKANAKLLLDAERKNFRLIGINYDITQDVLAKLRIDQLVEWLNESSEAVQVADENGIITFVNKEAARRIGKDIADLQGSYVGEIEKVFEDKNVWKQHLEEAKNKGVMLTTGIHKRADGSEFPVEASVKYHTSSDGKGYILAFIRDISERIAFEEKLNSSRIALEESQEIAKVGGWDVNLVSGEVKWTAETYRIHEEDPNTFIPSLERGLDFYTPETRNQIEQNLYKVIETGGSFDIEAQILTKDGSLKDVRIKGVAHLNEGKSNRITGIFQDITLEKAAERKLLTYAAELEVINKELDQFAYVVSHDLKAPLRAINNLSEWIQEDLEEVLEGDTKEQFDLLRGRVKRMEQLINGILQYSRAGRLKTNLAPIKVNSFIEDLCESLRQNESNVFTLEGPDLSFNADKIALEQVLSNFVSNAIKYNDKDQVKVDVTWKVNNHEVEFSVADNGPGIEEQYHDKIFVMFQTLQARDEVESTGVGLAIVKKIIQDKGGEIRVDSTLGEGTRFTFTWPLQEEVVNE